MEIGILVKIYQAGLINESMFAKVIENVSKRFGTIIVFLNKRHEKIMAFSKSGSEIMSKLMNCEKKGTCYDCKCHKLIIKLCGRKLPFRRLPSLSCLHRKAF